MPNHLQKNKNASAKFNTWLSRFFLVAKFGVVFYKIFLFPCNLLAQPADSLRQIPPAQWTRAQTVDIHHIALDLRFDFAKKQALGAAEITLSLLAPTNQIALDAGFLTIQSVSIKGCMEKDTPVHFTYEGGDKNNNLIIPLDRKYEACEKLTLRIAYHTNYHNDSDPNNLWGSYGKGLRFFSPTSTEPRKRRQIWSMGEPNGNRYWFPGWDAPGDFRTTEIRATVEQPLTVISNGKLISKKGNPDGTTTFHWKMDTPHANHQTSLVVGEYVNFQQSWDGIELNNFGYPDEQAATQASVERLPDMVRFFSEITGKQYPYPAYNQIFVQDFPWGGGHNIGSSTISENMIDDFGTHADFFYLWDGVEAQDLAAQWFGNLLTPRDWQDAWLSKSFAFYFDCLYTEYKNGHDEMLLWNRNFQHTTWLADWQAAMLELSNLYKKEGASASGKANIVASLRSVISGNAYWRLRNSALSTLQNLLAGQPLDKSTETLLQSLIKTEKSWLRSAAITFWGMAKDPKHADLFIQYFNNESDWVVNAAANALGKSKSPKAFKALLKLKDKPSWKNQSLISALNGLRELGDPRGAALALEALKDDKAAPRWTLATPIWDFRLAAAETLVALGKSKEGYPIVYHRFTKAMAENDVNDIFSNVLLMVTLGDAQGLEVFPALREKFRDAANAMKAVEGCEEQLRAILNN